MSSRRDAKAQRVKKNSTKRSHAQIKIFKRFNHEIILSKIWNYWILNLNAFTKKNTKEKEKIKGLSLLSYFIKLMRVNSSHECKILVELTFFLYF